MARLMTRVIGPVSVSFKEVAQKIVKPGTLTTRKKSGVLEHPVPVRWTGTAPVARYDD